MTLPDARILFWAAGAWRAQDVSFGEDGIAPASRAQHLRDEKSPTDDARRELLAEQRAAHGGRLGVRRIYHVAPWRRFDPL